MIFSKKANSDLILLILLVLRIELDSNIIRYRPWNRVPESRSVRLGSNSIYTQISHSNSYLSYPHPKSLGQNEQDEAAILFSRLNYFNSVQRGRENLITCIVNSPEHHITSPNEDQNSANVAINREIPQQPDVSIGAINELPSTDETVELTPEDMDLIEILWKQDIDLGVSRDAYDSRQVVDVEKLKDVEFVKEKDLYEPKDLKPSEETTQVPDPFDGLDYTIDSETGEHLFSLNESYTPTNEFLGSQNVQLDKNKESENELLKENDSLILDSFLPFEDGDFCDLKELFSPNEISDLVPEDLVSNPNFFLSDIDLEKEFEQFGILNDENEINSMSEEMYPDIESSWPDATNMMPLLAIGNSYQEPYVPIESASNLQPSTLSSNEGYVLQNSIPSRDSNFQAISSTIGSSSIGYAVAESIATLTNDSDPVPTNSPSENLYGAEFPEILYSNDTVAVSQNELISDLFFNELQLMTLPRNDNVEKEDYMETSSDSVSSDHLLPTSDYDNDSFSDSSFRQISCNDQYFAVRQYYSDSSENSACAISCSVVNINKKFDYSISKTSGLNYSNFLQHNHTYHLPFDNTGSCNRPGMRDKQRSDSDDDEMSNKDEKRAKELKLPISIADIINLAIEEYNERLAKYELTDAQLTLIRDIRRRGKNKVAAQNCRKRKMDQINNLQQDLDFLQDEKMKLRSKQNHLLQKKHIFEEKFLQLYELILSGANSRPPVSPLNQSTINSGRANSTDTLNNQLDSNINAGARTKRKFKK